MQKKYSKTTKIESQKNIKEPVQFSIYVELAPIGIFEISDTGTVLYKNQKAKLLLKNLKQESFFSFLPLTEISLVKKFTASQEPQFKTALIIDARLFSLKIIRNNNRFICYLQSISNTDDSSEKSLNKEQLIDLKLLAVKASNQAFWAWNLKNGEVYFDENYYKMLGYENNEFVASYESWRNLIHKKDIENVERQIKKHIKNKSLNYEIEFRIRKKDGSYLWILGKGKVTERDENNYPLKMVGVHIDISKQKQTEYKLKKAIEKAEESDNLKTAFLTNMSHEIRTPLNSILGFSELLGFPNLTDKIRQDYVNIIKKRGRDLLKIINDIIDLSKLKAKQVAVIEDESNINSELEELKSYTQIYKNSENKSKIKVVLYKDLPDKSALIEADWIKINQIMRHLLTNAVKFSHKGTITLGYKIVDENYLQFYVSDDGIGIAPEHQELIFESFRQLDVSSTRRYGGSGLGLVIVKKLVELIGGTLHLKSELNKGSCFSVTIPLKKAVKKEKKEKRTQYNWANFEILLIDSVLENSLSIMSLLKSTQIKIYHFNSEQNILKLYKEKKFNLIIIHYSLNKTVSIETIKQIKQNNNAVKFFIQGHISEKELQKYKDNNCAIYLIKDEIPALLEEINSTLKKINSR